MRHGRDRTVDSAQDFFFNPGFLGLVEERVEPRQCGRCSSGQPRGPRMPGRK